MSAEHIAIIRRVAQVVAAQNESAALTDYEHIAIQFAREILAALDEIERLRKDLGAKAG